MRISTQEFLLGSLNDLLAQQSQATQLNRQIASGQTLLDASDDPTAAAQSITVASNINQFAYDASNAAAAQEQAQTGVAALQQLTTVVSQLQQIATQAGNAATTQSARQGLVSEAQAALAQLIQLGNTQGTDGNYIFAGSRSDAPAFQVQADGSVTFNGDAAGQSVEVAPSLNVASTLSGRDVFEGVPAGNAGVAVSAASGNTGTAYAEAQSVTNVSQIAAEAMAGTNFSISFATGADGSLDYTVTSGTGDPASAGFAASSGVVTSGTVTSGATLSFGGINVQITGTPAAGDSFTVEPGQSTSLFAIAQNLLAVLGGSQTTPATAATTQQQVENLLADLGGAQTRVLNAQAALGSTLSEIQSVQQQNSTGSTNAQAALSSLQSANLPQVIAGYNESITALQASELAMSRLQGLTLFALIGH